MDENLDEKKCPVCGRPNLSQAEKCWYCQAPLEEQKETQQNSLLSEEELLDQSGEGSSFVQSAMEKESGDQADSTPEWLRRVRELIAAEKHDEEPVDDWQQQKLFDVPEKKAAKPVKKNTSQPENPTPAPAHQAQKERKNPAPKVEEPIDPQPQASEELPDGFMHLSTHSDNS